MHQMTNNYLTSCRLNDNQNKKDNCNHETSSYPTNFIINIIMFTLSRKTLSVLNIFSQYYLKHAHRCTMPCIENNSAVIAPRPHRLIVWRRF